MPLQATRSSKTEVIASIKDRVEMDRVNLPENLPTKINQFRNERDRLQEYLDIMVPTTAIVDLRSIES